MTYSSLHGVNPRCLGIALRLYCMVRTYFHYPILVELIQSSTFSVRLRVYADMLQRSALACPLLQRSDFTCERPWCEARKMHPANLLLPPRLAFDAALITTTRAPASCADNAATKAAFPPPTTITSYCPCWRVLRMSIAGKVAKLA